MQFIYFRNILKPMLQLNCQTLICQVDLKFGDILNILFLSSHFNFLSFRKINICVAKIRYHSLNRIIILWIDCDQKKSLNVYKTCPKMILLEKLKILTPLQKFPKNVGDLGKLIVAKCFKNVSKIQ